MIAMQTQHKVVSRDEWLKARLARLAAEKEFTRKRVWRHHKYGEDYRKREEGAP
jgi:predicted dithiol-disulfide oxidoreductase (DUF899 family)